MPNLKYRSFEPEVMDDLGLPSTEIDPVLDGLAKMNRWFGAHQSVIRSIKNFPVNKGDHISDWGSGGGDTLAAIRTWSDQDGLNLKLTGVDAAPAAIRFAEQHTHGQQINYIQAHVLGDELQRDQFDIVCSGLFSHHFDDEEWVRLIRKMYDSAKRGVILTDLHRHWVLYYAVMLITHTITGNKMVRVDGPLSVKRAFKKHEIISLLQKAQIDNYKLTWVWPFRWLLVIHK
ncbi:methyltransferase domain-containing protein [Mucilaginibacter myungsuensis]|uniref:Methyltransferase domain-containing protein n=1 Tax=Mucilaginibacter myungsuensis TaxID=649104 RepID=A0A929KW67_9SPHI|nr:methyltransferase domain-containing protein [Mucilaginibacter myungsuensis]MBE9661558.1 methyltransferase domain-containing protein [Mucilaginibacter myungsuensis]MDN3597701.1 methyltransferase domain-containing protein [Mucilaginibacter myungsuensis]